MKNLVNAPWFYVLLLGCFSLRALANTDEDLFALDIEQLTNISVTIASLNQQTTKQAASNVTVYSRKEILSMGINRVEELLNFVPGVTTSRSQHQSLTYRPIFRGRVDGATAGPGVLLLFNGQRLNHSYNGGGFEYMSQISLEAIKQVEVIRGPGSAIYGSNAFNGVVNIITQPQSLNLKLGAGQQGAQEFNLQVNQSFADFGFDFYYHFYQDQGLEHQLFKDTQLAVEVTQDPLQLNEFYFNGYKNSWQLSYRRFGRQYEDFILGDRVGNGINDLNFDDQNIRLQYTGFENNQWQSSVYAQWHEQTSDVMVLIAEPQLASTFWWTHGDLEALIGGTDMKTSVFDGGFTAKYSGFADHILDMGFDFNDETVDRAIYKGNWDGELLQQSLGFEMVPSEGDIQQGFWFPGDDIRDDILPLVHRKNWSFYVQDMWQISERTGLTFGSRYDHYDDAGNALSNRLTLVYRHDYDTTLKFMYGEAFRAPTIGDIYQADAPNAIGNAQLKPETIKTFDFFWEQKWDKFNLSLNVYSSRIEDQIQQVEHVPFMPGFTRLQSQNRGRGKLSGFELELKANPLDGLMVRAGYSHFRHQSDFGVVKNPLFIIINYSQQQWNINFNGYYHGEVVSRVATAATEAVKLAGFFKANAAVTYQLNKNVQLYLKAHNLFDSEYVTYDEFASLAQGLPERGRMIYFGSRIEF